MGILPKTVAFLCAFDHDAVHLHDQGLQCLPDVDIIRKAREERRILLTHDLDFAELVAASQARLPSVVVFRLRRMHPENVNRHLRQVLIQHGTALEQGAVVSVSEGQARVRLLPLEKDER
jgi:predicted nuclease of predicted toxin-antitoxin system